ncbi:MAG: NADP-dependent oxidoreductase [Candidatus Velthaea sp.]
MGNPSQTVREMRAFALTGPGAAPAMIDVPEPTVADGIVVRVTYAGANPVDYKKLDRLGPTASYPVIVGQDFAGVVTAVPADEKDFRPGDRIFGTAAQRGAYAEMTAVRPDSYGEPIARVPDGLSLRTAAGLPTSALAALGCVDALLVKTGTRLLILGAAGAVGGFALQMAHSRGAHVIGTVRGTGADDARSLGATEVYDSTDEDPRATIHQAHPEGFDAILDLVSGKADFARDIDLLSAGGRVASTIGAADIPAFAARGMHAVNFVVADAPESSRSGLERVAVLALDNVIDVRIGEEFAFDEAATMFHDLRAGTLRGKALLDVARGR